MIESPEDCPPLHNIVNTKKLKVPYKTTSNMSPVIKAHNKKIFSGMDNTRKGSNCMWTGSLPRARKLP